LSIQKVRTTCHRCYPTAGGRSSRDGYPLRGQSPQASVPCYQGTSSHGLGTNRNSKLPRKVPTLQSFKELEG
jgi:hypothetical protein